MFQGGGCLCEKIMENRDWKKSWCLMFEGVSLVGKGHQWGTEQAWKMIVSVHPPPPLESCTKAYYNQGDSSKRRGR